LNPLHSTHTRPRPATRHTHAPCPMTTRHARTLVQQSRSTAQGALARARVDQPSIDPTLSVPMPAPAHARLGRHGEVACSLAKPTEPGLAHLHARATAPPMLTTPRQRQQLVARGHAMTPAPSRTPRCAVALPRSSARSRAEPRLRKPSARGAAHHRPSCPMASRCTGAPRRCAASTVHRRSAIKRRPEPLPPPHHSMSTPPPSLSPPERHGAASTAPSSREAELRHGHREVACEVCDHPGPLLPPFFLPRL
jgi:hypothetical protein